MIETFKTGALQRYGLDCEWLQKINPDLIYCIISGYGRTSPLAGRTGYDYVVQAEGGLMSITGEADGEPMKVGVAVADLFTGMYATATPTHRWWSTTNAGFPTLPRCRPSASRRG